MEDEIIIEEKLASPLESWTLAAVLDGHGGDQVAKMVKRVLPNVLKKAFAGRLSFEFPNSKIIISRHITSCASALSWHLHNSMF